MRKLLPKIENISKCSEKTKYPKIADENQNLKIVRLLHIRNIHQNGPIFSNVRGIFREF